MEKTVTIQTWNIDGIECRLKDLTLEDSKKIKEFVLNNKIGIEADENESEQFNIKIEIEEEDALAGLFELILEPVNGSDNPPDYLKTKKTDAPKIAAAFFLKSTAENEDSMNVLKTLNEFIKKQ